ncbi:MAG: hypothetical protein ACLP50_15450 [Solirubrobacteraceae bacterium]
MGSCRICGTISRMVGDRDTDAAQRLRAGAGVAPGSWVAAAGIIGVLAAGCGAGGGLAPTAVSPQRILNEAIAAAQEVRSYRVQATGTDRSGRLSLTLEVDGPQRILAIERRPAGTIRFITLGLFTYVNAPRAFWATQPNLTPTEVAALSGRWLKLPTGISAELERAATRLGSLRLFAQCWASNRTSLSYVGRGSLDGHPVLILSNSGASPGTAPGKVNVSSTRPKLPLRTVITGPQKPGASADCRTTVTTEIATLSDFNQHFDISAPAHAISISGSGGTVIDDRDASADIATRST